MLLCAGLAACASSSDRPPPMHVTAEVADQAIDLTVSNIPAGREITALALLDDAGNETPAGERELITRQESSGGYAGPGVTVGATGGSSSGINPFISLGYIFNGGGAPRRSRRMTAKIPIPDPAAYADRYRDWHVVVRYRDQLGETQQVSIPAPPP